MKKILIKNLGQILGKGVLKTMYQIYKILIFKKICLNYLKSRRNRKIIVAGYIKKNARSFSVILIHQTYVTIKHSGKLFNCFFLKKRNITNKITLVDEDEKVISDDQLISEELNQFCKKMPLKL